MFKATIRNELNQINCALSDIKRCITGLYVTIEALKRVIDPNPLEEALREGCQVIEENRERMKENIDKVNAMVNELKGVVAMSRAALAERKSIKNEEIKGII